VEYRWDRDTGNWRVAILDTNAYGRVPLADMALAADQAIGMGEVPADKASGVAVVRRVRPCATGQIGRRRPKSLIGSAQLFGVSSPVH